VNVPMSSLSSRTLNSLRSRGVKTTLKIVHSHFESALFDRRYGVRTGGLGDNQSIKVPVFRSAFDSLQIPCDGVFVDFGSGKGRVLLLSVLYGFHRSVGIEFVRDLCVASERNLDRFRARTDRHFEVHVLNMDASCYTVSQDDSVFFLYDPFEKKVLEQVLSNIRRSLESKPRSIHIVYANPGHREVLDDDPFWRTAGEVAPHGLETFVYYRQREGDVGSEGDQWDERDTTTLRLRSDHLSRVLPHRPSTQPGNDLTKHTLSNFVTRLTRRNDHV
jgi:Histone methylation protein DOT1